MYLSKSYIIPTKIVRQAQLLKQIKSSLDLTKSVTITQKMFLNAGFCDMNFAALNSIMN